MAKKLLEIAAEIVQTQAASTSMNALEIASSLRQVFLTLQEIQKSETAGIVLAPQMMPEETPKPVAPQDSIKVICLINFMCVLTSAAMLGQSIPQLSRPIFSKHFSK